MGVTSDFAYYAARLLFQGTALPWSSTWRLLPCSNAASAITPVTLLEALSGVLPEASAGNWTIVSYVVEGDPPPPAEVIPYAYVTTLPDPWENETEADIVVRSIAMIAENSTSLEDELLAWSAIDTVTLEPGDTMTLTEFRFDLTELFDG